MTNAYDRDDFAPETDIKRAGTIKITNTETGAVEYSAVYDAAAILARLHRGDSIQSVIAACEAVEKVAETPTPEVYRENPFPLGM